MEVLDHQRGKVYVLSHKVVTSAASHTTLIVSALKGAIAQTMYCIPCKAWFRYNKFPNSRRGALFTPSLLLMRRLSQLVYRFGSEAECQELVEAAFEQAQRFGAPWSWYALDMELLLQKCIPDRIVDMLTYFTETYKGADQYRAAVLPMLVNVAPINCIYNALIWLIKENDVIRGQLHRLKVEYRIPAYCFLPSIEQKAAFKLLWTRCCKWGRDLSDEVLKLVYQADKGTFEKHVLPLLDISDPKTYLSTVWRWLIQNVHVPSKLPSSIRNIVQGWKPCCSSVTDPCCICFDDYDQDMAVQLESCSHVFHAPCLFQWATTSPLCPMCRAQVRPDYIHEQDDDAPSLFDLLPSFLTSSWNWNFEIRVTLQSDPNRRAHFSF